MSGDLRDARRSLPRGTLFAILVGFVIYMTLPLLLALNFDNAQLSMDHDLNQPGTQNYAVFDMSAFSSLVYVGLWGATLSSAMIDIVGPSYSSGACNGWVDAPIPSKGPWTRERASIWCDSHLFFSCRRAISGRSRDTRPDIVDVL